MFAYKSIGTALAAFAFVVLSGCVPEAQARNDAENAVLLLAAQPARTDCLFAVPHRTQSGTGILICASVQATSCNSAVFSYATSSVRNTVTNAVNEIGATIASCSTPAGDANFELNSLSLPGQLLAVKAGGVTGPHSSSFAATPVASCASIGMTNAGYLGSATRLATASELGFFAGAQGLTALKDSGGVCRPLLGLSSELQTLADAGASGSIALSARCDYGDDDASMTDCPAELQNSSYMFSGISTW